LAHAIHGLSKTSRKHAAHLKRAVRKIQIGSKEGKFPGNLCLKILRDTLGPDGAAEGSGKPAVTRGRNSRRRQIGQRGAAATPSLELSRLAHGPPLLKTFAAEHGPSLRRAERNCGFLSALRAGCFGFRSLEVISAWARALRALGFAVLTPLGLVFESLVGEKHLFAGGEDKLLTTLRTL